MVVMFYFSIDRFLDIFWLCNRIYKQSLDWFLVRNIKATRAGLLAAEGF